MLKPLNNRIIVKPDERESETKSGIIIPDTGKEERPETGVVVSGNALVASGDRILFSRYGLDEFTQDGETLYVISESAILAIIT